MNGASPEGGSFFTYLPRKKEVTTDMDRKIYAVSELNQMIKTMFDSSPELSKVHVSGELSNYKIYPSGHHYFTIKDQEASLRCVMFSRQASKLAFRPESGMKVIALGRVTVYPRDGAYQLYCDELVPQGAGDLQIAYEQLKKKLEEEGLFDPQQKKPLPRYPETIALITSGAGAAVRDMIRILSARYPIAKVIVLPVRVQGEEAPRELAGAINYANACKVADVIITGRGGGSIEDLWAFNDERVARAIFASSIPVISAVGHEPDVTIADYVADVRASTPSNAAEIAVPDRYELAQSLDFTADRMEKLLLRRIETYRERLEDIAQKGIFQSPRVYVDQRRATLQAAQERLAAVLKHLVAGKRERYVFLGASLDAMSPLAVLARGYSIARDEGGKVIKSAGGVKAGDRIDIRLHEGEIKCEVIEEA